MATLYRFLTPANPVTARKRWIAARWAEGDADQARQSRHNACRQSCRRPAIRIDGHFARSDIVVVVASIPTKSAAAWSPTTRGRRKIKGRLRPTMAILGISGRAEMIHRDDLVVGPSQAFAK
jgi:glutamate 5-kinase